MSEEDPQVVIERLNKKLQELQKDYDDINTDYTKIICNQDKTIEDLEKQIHRTINSMLMCKLEGKNKVPIERVIDLISATDEQLLGIKDIDVTCKLIEAEDKLKHVRAVLTSTEIQDLLVEIQRSSYKEGQSSVCDTLIQTNIEHPDGNKKDFLAAVAALRATIKNVEARAEEELYKELGRMLKNALGDEE